MTNQWMNSRLNYTGVLSALFCIFICCTRDINKTESFSDIFDYYRDQEGITALSLPPSLIELILGQSEEDENDLVSLMKDLSAFRIISLEKAEEYINTKEEMFRVINEFTLRNSFNDFFIMRNSEENILIRIQENKDIISEAIIILSGEEGLTVINLRGNIKPENIVKLIDSGVIQDIEGLYTR